MTDETLFGAVTDEDDEEEADSTDSSQDDNKNFVALRRDRNRLDKLVKAQTPELVELRTFKASVEAERRTAQVSGIFQGAGLNPNHAKLFNALNPEGEVTVEAVADFAKEYGLVTDEAAFGLEEAPAKTAGFKPFVGEDSPGNMKVSRVDWLARLKTNPEEAQRLFKQGRVDLSDLDLS